MAKEKINCKGYELAIARACWNLYAVLFIQPRLILDHAHLGMVMSYLMNIVIDCNMMGC